METPASLMVRLSRKYLLVVGSICFLFLAVSLDLVWFKTIFDFTVSPEKKWIYYAFLFFGLGCSSLSLLHCVWYFFFPPTLAVIDEKGVTFATGFRYNPYLIPGKSVKTAGYGMVWSMSGGLDVLFVAKIEFVQDQDVPWGLPTSMGVVYEGYTLYLPWLGRDTSAKTIIDTVEKFLDSGVWGPRKDKPPVGFQAVRKG